MNDSTNKIAAITLSMGSDRTTESTREVADASSVSPSDDVDRRVEKFLEIEQELSQID